jgi:hypothetical protein
MADEQGHAHSEANKCNAPVDPSGLFKEDVLRIRIKAAALFAPPPVSIVKQKPEEAGEGGEEQTDQCADHREVHVTGPWL